MTVIITHASDSFWWRVDRNTLEVHPVRVLKYSKSYVWVDHPAGTKKYLRGKEYFPSEREAVMSLV